MEIDGQFYRCEGCRKFVPFMGVDVSCDCGYSNDFEIDELEELEEAVEEAEDDKE